MLAQDEVLEIARSNFGSPVGTTRLGSCDASYRHMPAEPLPLAPEDFYMEGSTLVFTAAYHLKRGYCCGSGCRHCPYKGENTNSPTPDPSTKNPTEI